MKNIIIKNEKISEILFNIVLTFVSLFIIFVLYCMFFRFSPIIYAYNKYVLLTGIALYMMGIAVFYKLLIPKIVRLKYIEYFIFILFTILTIAIGIIMRVGPSWDMGSCYELAKEYAETGMFSDPYYLARFPHNDAIILIEIVLMRVFIKMGITDFIIPLTIIAALIISVSILLSFFCVKEMFNREKALLFLIIAFFSTPLYFYAVEYYTDTYSMFFSVIFLFLWIKMRKKDKSTILLDIIYGILLFIGTKIKLTSSFVFIAIVIYELLNGNLKKLWRKCLIIIPIFLILNILFNNIVVAKMSKKDARELYEVPTEHWIMMGLYDKGSFSYSEYEYIESLHSISEKKIGARAKIYERIHDRSIYEKFDHYAKKISFTWNDGSYFFPEVLRREKIHENRLHSFILVGYSNTKFYKYFPQIMHEAMLIFILINAVNIAVYKKQQSLDIVCIISLFGLMVFLLFWETRSRYLVNLLPIFLIAQINGITSFSDFLFRKKTKRVKA